MFAEDMPTVRQRRDEETRFLLEMTAGQRKGQLSKNVSFLMSDCRITAKRVAEMSEFVSETIYRWALGSEEQQTLWKGGAFWSFFKKWPFCD